MPLTPPRLMKAIDNLIDDLDDEQVDVVGGYSPKEKTS
jgi:hypothetical protein